MPAGAPEGVCPRCVLRLGWPGSAAAGGPATTPYRPGAKLIPPTPAELAPYFAPLEILELVGQGGMGAVYKVRQPKLDRLAALKILPGEAVAEDRTFAERFRREAQTLARLNHPGIVGVYDFGEAGGLFYFLMEFVDGVNLRQMLRDGSLRPHEALAIVPQICEALQYAHDEGVVHRDIKPENVLVDKKGRVKIADFGLAKLLGQAPRPDTLTGSRQVMGTPNYCRPNRWNGRRRSITGPTSIPWASSFTNCSPASYRWAGSPCRPRRCRWTCGWIKWCCGRWRRSRSGATSVPAT